MKAIDSALIVLMFSMMLLSRVASAQRVTNIMEVLDPNYQNSSLLYAKTSPNDNPFLVNEFLKADIVTSANNTIPDVEMKYDIEKQLLYVNNGERFIILNNKLIDSFHVQLPGASDRSTFIKVTEGDQGTYYQVLADNKIKLLKKTVKTRQNKTEVNSTGYNDEGTRPSRYRQNEFYYLLMHDGLHEVRLNAKAILKALNDPKYETCQEKLGLRLNQLKDIETLIKDCN